MSLPSKSCADACGGAGLDTTATTHPAQAYELIVRSGRLLLQAVDGHTVALQVPPSVVTLDASGSMTYHDVERVSQARMCALVVEGISTPRRTAITKFGTSFQKVASASAFLIDRDVGTKLNAAAEGITASHEDMRAQLNLPRGTALPPVNTVIISDCEQVSDQVQARRTFAILPLRGANVCIGVGDQHTLYSFMAAIPERCVGQTFYIKVPERVKGDKRGELEIPTDAIRDALLSTQIEFPARNAHSRFTRTVDIRVPQGADYLFPAGVEVNDILLHGRPLSDFDTPIHFVGSDATISLNQLQRYSDAATLNIVRAYNFALAAIQLNPGQHHGTILSPVIDLAREELLFITSLRERVFEDEIANSEIEAARAGIQAAAAGGCVSTISMAHLRRTVRRMRSTGTTATPSVRAADNIVAVLQELQNRVKGPPSAEATQTATLLLEAVGRGKIGSGSIAGLLGKTALRQDEALYATVANSLQMYEDSKEDGGGDAGAAPPASLAQLLHAHRSSEADLLDSLVTVKPVCTATFESFGALVAVGSVDRSPAGAENPLLTRVLGSISREPWKVQAVCLAGEGGFRASAGFANGIVGVFPGDSTGAAIALKIIASNMAIGNWNTKIHGLRSLLALLAGVSYLLKQLSTQSDEAAAGALEFANVLTHGFLGVAARTQCRVLNAAGSADETTPVVSGLSASRTLLLRAFAAPYAYVGAKIMPADYWLTLEFALRYAAARLGENHNIPARPFAFTQALINSSIARSATFFVTPRANSDDREAFDAQKRTINQFIKNVSLYIGRPAAGEADAESDAELGQTPGDGGMRFPPLTYVEKDVTVLNRHERLCIEAALDVVRRLDASRPEAELVRAVRATFWEAVSKGGNVSPESLAENGVYLEPAGWEGRVHEDANALRMTFFAEKEELLKGMCERAFLNAATSLPVAVYGSPIKSLRVSTVVATATKATASPGGGDSGGAAETTTTTTFRKVDVQASVGNMSGVLPGRATGLLKNVCLAIDSSHFLRGSFAGYLEESFTTGPEREKTFFPRFHASMTAWTESSASPATFTTLFAKAQGTWPTACRRHLEDSVKQWMWQRAAFKVVSESALPVNTAAAMLKCGAALGLAPEEMASTLAADWGAAGSDPVEAAACLSAYENREQWNYNRAVLEFYAAVRMDTDVFSGVFDASRFLAELALHRCFVVSRKMYRESLKLHGVADEDLDTPLCNAVYEVMAAKRLH